MIPLTAGELATLAGGALDGLDPAARIPGPVVSDSRDVVPGAVFVAVRGERVDGHEYADQAFAAGAAALLASRPVGGPAVLVDDTVAGLGRLAAGTLGRLPQAKIVGVTGSSGKTSTKDLLAQVLAAAGPTVAPAGSLNTEVGLPLTVLLADEHTRYLALEYSARGVGHIAYLTTIARPDVAVVLNVGSAHLGEFGSRELIAQAKGELVEALRPEGVAVLNGDDPLVAAMAERTVARVVTVGLSPGCDVTAEQVRLDELARPSFDVVVDGRRATVTMGLHGGHHVGNALACVAAALAVGMELETVAERLSNATAASRWRMEVTRTAGGVTVINDAYNANPESMGAALQALKAMAQGQRTWAVLGPMAELGDAADEQHETVGRLARQVGVDKVLAVGLGAAHIQRGAALEGSSPEESVLVPDIDAAVAVLQEQVRPGDVVLVKASRSAGLERVAAALIERLGAAT
ncbi:MAG: UDP-N-acetylmuramoyl-tripeptide--D-alanyl-D-alanine ligase [Frankiales bacterium]|nr:UDP-N-acetylmuramoyl-tripeptide--D-alanyl-D-alanine ligase [Frankiales bacterium]